MTLPAITRHEAISVRGTVDRKNQGSWFVVVAISATVVGLQADDWIASAAVLVLWAIWRFTPKMEGPPALSMALTFQWLQVVVGVFYLALGRHTWEIDRSNYRPMVLIGLGCVLALLFGLQLGTRLFPAPSSDPPRRSVLHFGWQELGILYLASVLLTGSVQELAWQVESLTQVILAVSMFRLLILLVLLRRLMYPSPRLGWIGIVLVGEVALGLTGYFGGFRDPLFFTMFALLEIFDCRRPSHWLGLFSLGAAAALVGFLWLGIRTEYRKDWIDQEFASSRGARAERVAELATDWTGANLNDRFRNLDLFIMRLWAVYYPALAVERVPAVLPHENGALLWGVVKHVLMPRLFFTNKQALPSDSLMVRRYSGVWVAGQERGTSIAFGYAAESYIDFGVPEMFLPVLVFGLFTGAALRWFLRTIRCRESGIVLVTVLAWSSLYLFERSWSVMLGGMLTHMIFLGGALILFDRLQTFRTPLSFGVPRGRSRPWNRGLWSTYKERSVIQRTEQT